MVCDGAEGRTTEEVRQGREGHTAGRIRIGQGSAG